MDRGPASGRALTALGAGTAGEAVLGGRIGPGESFGPGSVAWELNREALLLLGAGPRALLLQVAHPFVAAGVDEHSTFRTDPWGRLLATLRSYLRIVYGSPAASAAEVARLNELHRHVRGPGYAARDPALSLWVHSTLVDSTMVAYDAWIEPLDRDRRERFYAETLPLGRAFGIPEPMLPADLSAFERYVAEMLGERGPILVSPVAREIAALILRPPLGPLAAVTPGLAGSRVATSLLDRVPGGAYAWLLWPSIGLLPPSVREGYGLSWGPCERLVSAWLVAAWRAWRPLLPTWLRQMPQALAADRRVAAPEADRREAVGLSSGR